MNDKPMDRLTAEDIKAFEPDQKVGLIATRDVGGLPRITLITTLSAKSPTELVFGQFSAGESKRNLHRDPKVGFFVMTDDRVYWRGKAQWTHRATEGEDFERFNQRPMFRYNSYFGIHTVQYFDLISCSRRQKLDIPGMLTGSLSTVTASALSSRRTHNEVLNSWSHRHMNRLATLKFLAYVDADGYPNILPIIPCRAVSHDRLVIATPGARKDLRAIPQGATVAVFALSLEAESVLVRGAFSRSTAVPGMNVAHVDLDWVYNSMPPKQGQIYPPIPLQAVTEF